VEAPLQVVCPAFLAADQRMHDLHAGELGQHHEPCHWTIAFHTGLLTGLLAVLLTFTPAAKLYGNRYGNALIVGSLTALGTPMHTSVTTVSLMSSTLSRVLFQGS
jgi:hypothetical protein